MAIICLVSGLLRNSSGLPENHVKRTTLISRKAGERFSYLTLLRVGFTLSRKAGSKWTNSVTTAAVGSYPAFSPLPRHKVMEVYFLWYFPYPDFKSEPRVLPGTLFCEVRTFLSPINRGAIARIELLLF